METLFNSPDKYKKHDETIDGYKTHFIEAGDPANDRLLLVHGGSAALGAGLYRWYPTVLPLAEKLHVFAVDELGHGFTDPPRDIDELGHVRVRAEHVIRFIEERGLAPVNLCGQSQGGWIVTYITITRPELVKKLVLVDSGSTAGSGFKTGAQNDVGDVQEIDGEKIRTGGGELPYFKKIFEPGTMLPKEGLLDTREGIRMYTETFAYDHSMVTDEYVDYLEETSKRWTAFYLEHRGKKFWDNQDVKGHHDMYFFEGKHIRDHVHRIKNPTLFIAGKNSVKGIDPQYELYKRMPNAQMHILDKASHFCWWDQVRDFNDLVLWFVTKGED